MAQPSSFATLIIVSLLSCHQGAGVSDKRSDNGVDTESTSTRDGSVTTEEKMLVNIFQGASIVLTAVFAVAATLPPSSLILDLDIDTRDSPTTIPEISTSCRSSTRHNENHVIGKSNALARPVNEVLDAATTISEVQGSEIDEGDIVEECELSVVSEEDVKSSWMKRARVSKRHTMSPPQPRRLFLTPISEIDPLPTLVPCDSLMSISSDISLSSRSSCGFEGFSTLKKTRQLSPQRNAEWAIIE